MRIKLKDAFELQIGKTPSRNKSEYWNGVYKWVSISDIGNSRKYVYSTRESITNKGIIDSGIKVIPKGTVIMSFKLSIGKTAITTEDMYTNEAIVAFIDKKKIPIDIDYLYYLCSGSNWMQGVNKAVMGLTLNKATLSEKEINIPNIEIQKKCAGNLDKIDRIIDLKKQQLDQLDLLVRSLFIEMFGDIINTSKYPTVNLGSLGEMLSGGTPSSKHSEYFGGNIPFISTPCLGENYISYKNAQNFLTDEGVKNSTTNLIPAYSLMIGSRVGVGKCSINMCEMCTNQDILSFINIDETKYDLLFIKNVIEQYFDFYESQKRGATIKGISSKIVKETKVPKAPLLLQKKFANFVRGTDKSKLTVKKSLEELEILKKFLMQKYFA